MHSNNDTNKASTSDGGKRNWYASLSEQQRVRYIKRTCESRKRRNMSQAHNKDQMVIRKDKNSTQTQWLLKALSVGYNYQGGTSYAPTCSELHKLEQDSPCIHCKAKRLQFEPPTFCCQNGQVKLANNEVPDELYSLFVSDSEEAHHFRKHIRAFNSIFSFTSFGVNYDRELASLRRGVYTFRAHGQIYHELPSLIPGERRPEYFQLYFYDTSNEVQNRMDILPDVQFREDVMNKVRSILQHNPYAQFFQTLKDHQSLVDCQVHIRKDVKLDQRVYNAPTADQVAAIWVEGNDPHGNIERNIVVHGQNGERYQVKHYFGCYDPLQYPLLFPKGEIGWHQDIKKTASDDNEEEVGEATSNIPIYSSASEVFNTELQVVEKEDIKKVSCRQYYCYKFQDRECNNCLILLAGRLFQQYAVDMYIKLETTRLDYFRHQQKDIRSELYQGIVDSVIAGEVRGSKVGKRVVLPGSFVGGPRDMRRRYLDAMALVERFGKPDLFITVTCNADWKEIQQNLKPGQTAQDRPDLVSRVFRGKLQDLKDQLFNKHIFGEVAANVHVIEFQKRGLPHAHMLIILKRDYKITSADQYDKYVSAELPDKGKHPKLHELVVKHMMHGPCGEWNKKNSCMVNGECKNRYPRPFTTKSTCGDDGYPIYMRRNDGQKVKVRRKFLDNSWVVPYNSYLLTRYNCHINVEICSGITAVKYLYKYIYKGHDRVAVYIAHEGEKEVVDEIKSFQDARWVSPPEALWRMYEFKLNEMSPPVINLQLHLPLKHSVSYWKHQNLENLIYVDHISKTMLTEFFRMYSEKRVTIPYLYREFVEHFVWDKQKRVWKERKRGHVIGRINGANPSEGERYYLRLLLNHVRGPTSFEDLLTVDGQQCKTFKQAAQKRGLLESDQSIYECLNDAISFEMPHTLRRLFAIILVHCEPSDVRTLWNSYLQPMSEDFARKKDIPYNSRVTQTLTSVNKFLESMGKGIEHYDLPSLPPNDEDDIREIREEMLIETPLEDIVAQEKLNHEQQIAFTAIQDCITLGKGGVFFIDGPGGTGKTYLYRSLLANLRSRNLIALATATSGVAAALMPGGRTAHSRFKIPISANESTTCNIAKQSGTAELMRRASLIIWDEAPMAKRFSIETLDRSMKDIMDSEEDFGGKVFVFGGDFRQVLPVVPRATREETVNASLVCSTLWPRMKKFKLNRNMRAREDPSFGEYLLRVGNGTEPTDNEGMISIPEKMIIHYENDDDPELLLINSVFSELQQNAHSIQYITNRAILAARNECVDKLNERLISMFPGRPRTFTSFDEAIDDIHQYYQQEFLNALTPNGLPPHRLVLKQNCPIMLLRNLDPSNGLCNGTRLVCKNFKDNVICAEIATGQHSGKLVFIPRIPLCPAEDEGYPFKFKRKQFPIRLCFAMTINKAQGQTIPFVGIYLPQNVFSHGQLYVALSRGTSMSTTKVVIKPQTTNKRSHKHTKNVVFKEVLQ